MKTVKGLLNLTKRSARWLVLGLGILILFIGYYLLFIRNPYTTDAFVQGNYIKVAARASGPVTQVYVSNNQVVKKGELLFEIDPSPYQLAVQRAQAELKALSELASEGKRVQRASALALAKQQLAYTKVYAPVTGTLSNFYLRPGTYVNAGQLLFSIVENNHWWVQANYLEYELRRIKPGQQVDVKLSMYPGEYFKGRVTGIGPAISRGRLISPETNLPEIKESINWVRLFSRFPVFIELINPSSKYPMRIGATAAVIIHVK